MKQSFTYDPTEPLSHISRVEAPPFLLTRIRQKATDAYRERLNPVFAWASCVTVALVIGLNAWILTGERDANEGRAINVPQNTTEFFPDNSLYE